MASSDHARPTKKTDVHKFNRLILVTLVRQRNRGDHHQQGALRTVEALRPASDSTGVLRGREGFDEYFYADPDDEEVCPYLVEPGGSARGS